MVAVDSVGVIDSSVNVGEAHPDNTEMNNRHMTGCIKYQEEDDFIRFLTL